MYIYIDIYSVHVFVGKVICSEVGILFLDKPDRVFSWKSMVYRILYLIAVDIDTMMVLMRSLSL